MQERNIVADDGGLPCDEASGVIQENTDTERCRRVDIHG